MALIWADFPNEQRGLYGTDHTKMLTGAWAAFEGGTGNLALVDDPDPSVTTAGVVIKFDNDNVAAPVYARFTYPAAVVTAGVSFKMWLNEYPSNDSTSGNAQWEIRNISNTLIARVRVGASGQFLVHNAAGTLIHTGAPADVVPTAFNLVETKVTRDASAGTIEIRVNNDVKANLSGLALGSSDIVNIAIGQVRDDPNAHFVYYKDIVFWDTTGTSVNDFLGNVFVHDIWPDADDTLNWEPSVGATGFNLIDDANPSGVLTVSGVISDGNVVRIDDTYYRWSTGSLDSGSPAGTSANPWRVLIGATEADSLLNLFNAIGDTGVAGTDYSTDLTAHTTVVADGVTDTQLSVEATLPMASSIVTTETGANTSWAAATLTGGPTDPSYIFADNAPPPESIFTLTDLPEDVVAIRAVMPIGRLLKSDGGDCTVQMGVSPNGADWFDGEDREVTVAATYYRDVSYVSPDTGASWTPTEVNSMLFRVDRTT